MQRAVTLREVAHRAEVHPSTASRALNPATRDLVNEDTAERVIRAAKDLGYRPNSMARGLKTNKTFSIGMLLPDLTNPLFPPIVRAMEDTLGAADYTLILGNTDNDAEREQHLLASMINRRVDGLILATAHRHTPAIAELVASGLPLVLVNRTVDDQQVPSVTTDDHAGIGLAVQHLVELGHTRIAHVGGPQHLSTGLSRYQGFLAWMKIMGLDTDPQLVSFADWYHEDPGAKAFWSILDRRADFTAVVAANDLIAIGCYDVLNDIGRSIGGEVSVVGYNDMPFADKLSPPLTTVRIPHYQIGVRAAELLLDLINDTNGSQPVSIKLTPSLVVRRSTGPIGE
ncbi:MAG TPA: LacI family DNA-binding transcriptional regulator [Acidimicrobiia bacterium]|nr:LacI family DNA-binding transcriptional regulator [Acidimicrobiia bacterium]